MKQKYEKRSLAKCIEEAQKYNSMNEWRKNRKSSIEFLRKTGVSPSEFFKRVNGIEHTIFQNVMKTSNAEENKEVAIAWACADKLLEFWKNNSKCGHHRLHKVVGIGSYSAYLTIVKKFKTGWVPLEDKPWVEWSFKKRQEFGV